MHNTGTVQNDVQMRFIKLIYMYYVLNIDELCSHNYTISPKIIQGIHVDRLTYMMYKGVVFTFTDGFKTQPPGSIRFGVGVATFFSGIVQLNRH